MKKLTLFAIALLASVVSFAALNPYAYGLSSSLSADKTTLTVNYSLNATATAVSVVILDREIVVKTVDCADKGLTKGAYTVEIPTTEFPTGKKLTWKVEVKGNAVATPTQHATIYKFYHPSGVDIDNNPENPTFGMLLVNEGMQSVKSMTEGYVSAQFGAGIFAFNAAFEPMPNGDKPGYNGGIEFTNGRADGTGTAYSPRRIRISEDGRIFVTSLNTDGNYLWEVNPANMNEWTTVFQGTLNKNKELVDAKGNFIAAPNNGFDVKGSGENLQLAMYSVNLSGITAAAMSGFRCDEYNLGTATTWATAPSKNWVLGKYAINYTGTQVVYDNEGGIWIASYRGTADDTNPGLVHINKDGVEDAKLIWNNVRQAGIRFNKDFTKLVVAGNNGTAQKATIYTISKDANGAPVLTEEAVINMAVLGNNLNDFAFDYAGNLYSCGNSSEKLVAWAMPRTADEVVATPAASKYTFHLGNLPPEYTITATANNETMGTVSGDGKHYEGETVTLEATPKTGHEFVNWSNGETANPLVFTATEDVELTANFKVLQYTVTVGVNNETMGSVTNAGEHTLDYGTELVLKATSNTGYRFVKWSTGATANPLTTTVTGDAEIIAQFELAPVRAWAYDLEMEVEDKAYTFTFKATTIANATLVFTNAEGAETGTVDLGTVAIGVNTKTLAADEIPGEGEIQWAVKLAGEAIGLDAKSFTLETTDATRGIYNFYLPQDVTVDNNPESDYFGQIYVAAATNGATDGSSYRADNQKRGVFVYDQELNELNPTSNVGIIPSNVTLADATRHAMHRMAVNPVDNHVAFAYNVSKASAVWCMDPANLSGEATDLIAGLGITKANSICFDEDGVLYVMDNGNTSTGGTLVKVENGALTKIVQSGIWGVEDNAIVSDGRGGIWIAQNRAAIDAYAVLSHVNKAGEIDFKVTTASADALKNLFPTANGNASYRGQCAYYVKDDLLAFGGNGRGTVYKVTYDATTGIPSLSLMYRTPYIGANIDGLAFDYAGDLYLVSATKERFYKFTLPTNDNTCTTPAPKALVITKPSNPTVLDNTVVAPQVEKIVRNGQVLIIRDGKTFNMMGQEVR